MTEEEILSRISQLEAMKQKRSSPSRGLIMSPKIEGMEITDLDAMRRKKMMEQEVGAQFPSAKERGDLAEKDLYTNRIQNMTQIFDKAYPFSRQDTSAGKAQKQFPAFGRMGVSDKLIGAEVAGKRMTGMYPKSEGPEAGWDDINAYEDLSAGFLTTLAKQAGEQRPTDQDVQRFKKSLMGFGKDPGTNKILRDTLMQDSQTMSPKAFLLKYTGNQNLYGSGE